MDSKPMLGYLRDELDERDFGYGAYAPSSIHDVLPPRFSAESLVGPAFDQGGTDMCVAFTCAALKRYHEFKESRIWIDIDPYQLYYRCKAKDGHANEPGTFPRVALELMATEGARSADCKSFYKISAYARIRSLYELKTAIANTGPALLGIRVDVASLQNLAPGAIYDPKNEAYAGHCMLAVGYDDDLQCLRVRNSWGTAWGDNGHFWLPFSCLDSDPNFDAWTAVDLKEAA